jgi:hypothetical protein
MKKLLLYCVSLFVLTNVLSQSCTVSIDALKGEYTGECKKGKADGKGIATGIDTYAGNFKKGLPNGEGKYTWKNGSWYEGSWKNGLFDGHGTYSNFNGDSDSSDLRTGFWKKGTYVGKYENPFSAKPLTNNISDVNIRKLREAESEITIDVKTITGGASSAGINHLPKASLINVQLIEGRFEQEVADETSSIVTNKYVFRKVTFPFSAIFTFQTIGHAVLPAEKVQLTFFEDCNCYVKVSIDN